MGRPILAAGSAGLPPDSSPLKIGATVNDFVGMPKSAKKIRQLSYSNTFTAGTISMSGGRKPCANDLVLRQNIGRLGRVVLNGRRPPMICFFRSPRWRPRPRSTRGRRALADGAFTCSRVSLATALLIAVVVRDAVNQAVDRIAQLGALVLMSTLTYLPGPGAPKSSADAVPTSLSSS